MFWMLRNNAGAFRDWATCGESPPNISGKYKRTANSTTVDSTSGWKSLLGKIYKQNSARARMSTLNSARATAGFTKRSIHPALRFTFTINACNIRKVFIWLVSVWKLKIYGFGTVSTSSCMFRMETNGETDHLRHDLFVNISYKFTVA